MRISWIVKQISLRHSFRCSVRTVCWFTDSFYSCFVYEHIFEKDFVNQKFSFDMKFSILKMIGYVIMNIVYKYVSNGNIESLSIILSHNCIHVYKRRYIFRYNHGI